jgi:GTPase SAR1 family protein
MGYLIALIPGFIPYKHYIFIAGRVAICLTLFAAVGFALWGIWNYLRTMWRVLIGGKGPEGKPIGKEPAFKQYFFHKAWLDYKEVARQSWDADCKDSKRVMEFCAGCFQKGKAVLTWPVGGVCFIAWLSGAAVACAICLIFALAQAMILALCASVMTLLAWLLRLVEYARMAWNHISMRCPHSECYRRITIPMYKCPKCGAEHRRLIPGSYGLFERRCQCKTTYLRTMFLLGLNQLPNYCPHCQQPLHEQIGVVRNLHIPIVGGASAGKTSFLMANLNELYLRKKKGEIGLDFPSKQDEVLFERCRDDFAEGSPVGKTQNLSPAAFQVNVRDSASNAGLLYVYDAAGELYQEMDTLRRHDYYSYTDGILLLLDPFSLPRVKADFESELSASANAVRPSDEEPLAVYARMIASLRQHTGMKNGSTKTPLAIVVTKADAFKLDREIHATLPEAVAPASGLKAMREALSPKTGSRESAKVRQWLIEHGAGNLVRVIEQDFQEIRYFYCSALGRLPDSSSAPFTPKKALEPLVWLMDHYHLRLDKAHSGGPKSSANPAKTPAGFHTSSGQKIYNQVAALSLWFACVIGSLTFAAPYLRSSSNGVSAWFHSNLWPWGPLRPLTPAEAEQARKQVASVIDAWIVSLKNRNFDQHVSYYADEYFHEYFRRQTRDGLRRQIEGKFNCYSQLRLDYENLEVTPDEYGFRARAVFIRKWKFEGDGKCEDGTFKESVDLKNFDGAWLIVNKSAGKRPLDSSYKCQFRSICE